MEDGTKLTEQRTIYYVGVAASAGGLEAASALVQNLPKGANAVYILAQHMSPTHKSLLTSLISRETTLPVVELVDDCAPELDTIYVTPPNSDVVLEDGRLRLRDPQGHQATPKPSADRLFKSLAQQCGETCVAIVLSGTGSDGSYGVQAVREAGGITIAQDVTSAKYDGMPASAIETGCIDLTLTPEQIGIHLTKILDTPRDLESLRQINVSNSHLADLLQILLIRTQIDFRDYKESTIQRRIKRRMVALGMDDYDKYVELCRTSEDEIEALHRDFLISVTRFFRDPEQFDHLREVIRELIETRQKQQLRVWVAGCATGEEAYSIAALIAEAMGGSEKLKKSNVQIFASDIDERALDIGRRGLYPSTAAADIPKPLLERYFEFNGGHLQVKPSLRSVVLFSRHNVAQDPPFINVDLVSLRNILIYFNSGLQERVLKRVHYALNADGSLFLGTSEAVGSMNAFFEQRGGTDKVFAKRAIRSTPALNFADPGAVYAHRQGGTPRFAAFQDRASRETEMFDALARAVAPHGFMVTETDQIVRVFGDISNVISLSEESVLNMSTRILRAGLRDEASSLITVTLKTREARSGRWHVLDANSGQKVRVRAYPVTNTFGGEHHVLFALEYREQKEEQPRLEALSDEDRLKYVRQVEQEMLTTRETLRQTVEELQTSNEELQSVNEELQSANEELQASNEELETSNEELQSTNEELITVNEEMQVNAAELQRITIELSSIVKHAAYPIIVVDQSLVIRRMSDKARDFFGLDELPATGFHVAQVPMPRGLPNLATTCGDAFRERVSKSLQIEYEGRNFTVHVTPFSAAENMVIGLKITVVEQEVSSFFAMAEAMDDLGGIGHWRLNCFSNSLYWSKEVFRLHGLPEQSETPSLQSAINYYHPDDRKMVSDLVERAMNQRVPFAFEARIVKPDGTVVPVQSAGKVVPDQEGNAAFVVGAFVDRSHSIRNQMLVQQFEDVQDALEIGFFSYDIENQKPFWSRKLYEMLGLDPVTHMATMESAVDMFHPEDRDRVSGHVSAALNTGAAFEFTARLQRAGGQILPCVSHGRTLSREDGEVAHVYGFFRLVNET